ncbi:glycosyltransferase family 2 protein [Myroides odoratimimus]|uniref:glycosyltransferase family 2 protein n=1 Tax=Myroides odoratimimus TaxID=76832 RepID=UPI00046ADDE4|nr:glycosyltransferase family 2 protein [Myroides odoratimimus]
MNISVVIPSYNSEKTILFCLESVINQKYLPFEIIIIDDGSSDSSVLLIENFSQVNIKVPIHVYCQENSGPSTARNLGVTKAKGEWIAFLDSDDCWHSKILQNHVDLHGLYSNSVLQSFQKGKKEDLCENQISKKVNFYKLCYKNYFHTSSVLIKKSIFEKYKFDVTQKYSEDYKLWLEVSYNYPNQTVYNTSILCYDFFNRNIFGESGLSSKLWEMEKGEISNFTYLYSKGYVNYIQKVSCQLFSLLKYFRRVLIVKLKK